MDHSAWNTISTVTSFDRGSFDENKMCESTHIFGGSGLGHPSISSTPTVVTTPISILVQSLIKQLCTMLEKDHNKATKLYNSICENLHKMKLLDDTYVMGEFEAMRSQYQRALHQLVSVTSGSDIPIPVKTVWPISPTSGFEWSRYRREFEEILFIARGGFGNVFKAKHQLDGVIYAVKKICIHSSDLDDLLNHLSEVKTFASLNHPNIVSYKAAWLEPFIEQQEANGSEFCHGDESSDYLSRNTATDDSDLNVSFRGEDSSIHFSNLSNMRNVKVPITNDECKVLCALKESNNNFKFQLKTPHIDLKWATLYIQMSLCQTTLKQWLEERKPFSTLTRSDSSSLRNRLSIILPLSNTSILETNISDNPYIQTVIEIFTQLTKGLHYIHQCKIIHHDVKPSNIFINIEENDAINVQLGDFGLACPLQKPHLGVALGTRQYAAPEQLEGHCDKKSDLYSLGIILLEMIENCNTDMEKIEILNDLRKGHIPAHVTACYPKLAHIISKLVEKEPSKRIDTVYLLKKIEELKEDKDRIIKDLQDQLLEKDAEIAKLKSIIAMTNS